MKEIEECPQEFLQRSVCLRFLEMSRIYSIVLTFEPIYVIGPGTGKGDAAGSVFLWAVISSQILN